MFKKLMMIGLMAISCSASANSMSAQPLTKGYTLQTNSSESRQHYEKQSRVSHAADTTLPEPSPAEPAQSAETTKTTEEAPAPAKLTPPAKRSTRSGGMRY